ENRHLYIYSALLASSLKRQQCHGLFFYNELLHVFYRSRICDYKNTRSDMLTRLDAVVKVDMRKCEQFQESK
ncbi:hypothetical protein Dimus_018501, partial [Dionaea muscipula]